MGILFGLEGHLVLLLGVGPVLPAETDLLLLLGDGYIAGYFLASLFLPDSNELLPAQAGQKERKELEIRCEKERRIGGGAMALVLSLVWLIGQWVDPAAFPFAPADRNLFSAVPVFGIGAVAAVLYAPLAARKVKDPEQRPLVEHKLGESRGRIWGLLFAGIYIGVWLCAG